MEKKFSWFPFSLDEEMKKPYLDRRIDGLNPIEAGVGCLFCLGMIALVAWDMTRDKKEITSIGSR
jgi:hypothetical protein